MRKHVLAVVVLSLGFTPAPPPKPRPKPTQPDQKLLQGEWVRVRHAVGGRPVKPEAITLVIAGDRLAYGQAPADGQPAWVIRLDERKKPKVLDREWVVPGSLLGECWRGVYTLDGDTLTVCSVADWSEANRPADLSGKAPRHVVEVFRRKKP